MAGTPTTNYALPTYADADAPDLTGAYNSAMTKIDTQMKKNATDIASLEEEVAGLSASSFNPQSTDKNLTVAQLSEAKVTANGIVYFKPAS